MHSAWKLGLAATLIAAVITAGAAGAPPFSTTDLPDIGEPADQTMSPRDERRIGNEVVSQLYRYGYIDEDPELQDYLVAVGERLVAAGGVSQTPIRFYTIADRRINAFALPGGHIGMNRGLLMAASSESEVAGVMAHEIAHVTQRHIARTQDGVSGATLATWAGVLLAILAGSADADVVLGALSLGQAINVQRQINYTRSHELEADRLGIQTLAAAGYDPQGVVNFFSTLEQQTRLYGSGMPEILRTHPLNTRRIAEARARAERLPEPEAREDLTFQLMQARARVLSQERPGEAMTYFGELIRSEPDNTAYQYGFSLALLRVGRPVAAIEALTPALAKHPRNLNLLLAQGEAFSAARQLRAAHDTFSRVTRLFPRSGAAVLAFADWLIDQGEPVQARALLLDHPDVLNRHVHGYRLLADAAELANDDAEAAFQMANYHFLRGDPGTALAHLDAGLRVAELGPQARARLVARRAEVREALPRNWTPEDRLSRRFDVPTRVGFTD